MQERKNPVFYLHAALRFAGRYAAACILLFFLIPRPAYAYSFTDDLGRELEISAPQRVVSTIGSYTKIWMLAGGEDTLVAASNDSWEEFHLDLSGDVVNLGKTKELNMELLAAAQPDLVLASGNTQAGLDRLPLYEQMGIPAAYFTVNTFEEYLHMLQVCCELTGHPENYVTYGETVAAQVNEALSMQDGSSPSVLYIRVSGKGISAKSSEGTILGILLKDLGANNIADHEGFAPDDLSMEVVLAENPDFIFLVKQIGESNAIDQIYQQQLLGDPLWGSLDAVQTGHVYLMDPELYNLKPCERWGEAYLNLAEILYETK